MQPKQHIFFIGMMGTGKTTIGKKLAKQIQYPWVDTDQQIEKNWNCSIAEYFEKYGELAFRQAETETLYQLVEQAPASVITTGGGIVLRPENRTYMKQHGQVIHLTAHPDELIRRLEDNQSRPLLRGDLKNKVRQLAREREPLYKFADVTINTTYKTPTHIVEEINHYLIKS